MIIKKRRTIVFIVILLFLFLAVLSGGTLSLISTRALTLPELAAETHDPAYAAFVQSFEVPDTSAPDALCIYVVRVKTLLWPEQVSFFSVYADADVKDVSTGGTTGWTFWLRATEQTWANGVLSTPKPATVKSPDFLIEGGQNLDINFAGHSLRLSDREIINDRPGEYVALVRASTENSLLPRSQHSSVTLTWGGELSMRYGLFYTHHFGLMLRDEIVYLNNV